MAYVHIPSYMREQDSSIEEQHFVTLAFARRLIGQGLFNFPDFGLLEFDACTLWSAHRAGRLNLKPELYEAVIQAAQPGPRPNGALRQEIHAQARKFLDHYIALLDTNQLDRGIGGVRQ